MTQVQENFVTTAIIAYRPAPITLAFPMETKGFSLTVRKAIQDIFVPYVLPALLAGALVWIIFALPSDLPQDASLTLTVLALAIVGWTLTRIPDSVVAIAGATALAVTGVLPEHRLYAALGSEIVWLLLAAFIIAAVLTASGLAQRFALSAVRPFSTVTGLFHGTALMITATAFIIPSTSGRAAMLLPVFIALADRMPDSKSVRALALLFPTVILLSAGGSLIGAGAHFVAVDAISHSGGPSIGYLEWIAFGLPLVLLVSHLAVALILWLFVTAEARSAPVGKADSSNAPLTGKQWALAGVLAAVIALWLTAPLHGIDIALISIAGAGLMLTKLFTDQKSKDIFSKVEVELIVFLAATVVIAEAMISSGASTWLAERAIGLLPGTLASSLPAVVTFVAVVAVLSHLLITSRTARAAVLIPAVALPVAGFGHDATLIIMVTVLGTGFCQTMMASAKPVALYGNLDRETFTQKDLLRLALPLLPVKLIVITAFALLVWPLML